VVWSSIYPYIYITCKAHLIIYIENALYKYEIIIVSVRGGLTLDEGIYIAQIVAQTGDFVFEMSVLCIACGFSFVMVIIFS